MKTFYLVRHGEKDYNNHDGDGANMVLSKLGNKQADKTGKYLAGLPISYIAASPVLRVQQTAKHIASYLKLPIHTDNNLKERMEYSKPLYGTFENFIDAWVEHSRNRTKVPAYGDSAQKAGERFQQALSSRLMLPDTHLLMVTHGGIIIDFLINMFPHEELEKHVPHYKKRMHEETLVYECSITIITVKNNRFSLESFANTRHLE